MKNCLNKISIITLLFCPTLILSSDKYSPISFKTDDGIVQVSKKNVPLIGALYERYTHYIEHGLKRGAVPLLPGTSKKEVELVNRALNTRPDTFANSFLKLTKEEQGILVNALGLWKKDQNNKIVMGLYVPDLIKRFIYSYTVPVDVYDKHIKPSLTNPDDDYVLNYCRRQLINYQGFLSPKQPISESSKQLLTKMIDLQSLFINGSCVHKNQHPVPLPIDNEMYQTYAYNFVSEYGEYRVTEIPGLNQYALWFIDHAQAKSTNLTILAHNSPIIGCCFSKTKTNTEYIITYSEKEIIFSTITIQTDGSISATPHILYASNNSKIITGVYDTVHNNVHLGTCKNQDNFVSSYKADGTFISSTTWPMKDHGILEHIMICKNSYHNDTIFYIFTVAGMYSVYKYELDVSSGNWTSESGCGFSLPYKHNANNAYKFNQIDLPIIYNFWASPFESIQNAAKKKEQSSFWQSIKDDIYFEPTDECHKRYSPLGNLLLRHSVKKKLGTLYLQTEVHDVKTDEKILSLDTLHANFAAVGFSQDEQELIFINHAAPHEKVSLNLNESNKKALDTFKNLILSNYGTASLLKDLSIENDQTGSIMIDQKDPIYSMLIELGQHPQIGNLVKICFPIS